MKENIFGKVPESTKLTYAGKQNTSEDLYLFHVPPIPTVCHAKVLLKESICRVRYSLLAHDRYLTMEELSYAKEHLFEDDEALIYLFNQNVPMSGLVPDQCVIPFMGKTRPEVTAFVAPSKSVPRISDIISRFDFCLGKKVFQKKFNGRNAVIIKTDSPITYKELHQISKEYFESAVMFHSKVSDILSQDNAYILWETKSFPELQKYLEN